MTDFTTDQERVAANIVAIAAKYRAIDGVPVLVHLAVTDQESGWNETAAGDQGNSFGPYQLYVVAHPEVTPAIAESPWFDYGFPIIHDRWRSAWGVYGGDWQNATRGQRVAILQQFAPNAQGSIAWSADIAAQRYDEAEAMLDILS